MIFVTVGAQMPFDRLVQAVDQWASTHKDINVFAQVSNTKWRPLHVEWAEFLDPPAFQQKVENSQLVVAHAGMGSIITALELGKPILVMPRRGDLKETRNDHQVATAKRFLEQGRIHVAFDEAELIEKLNHWESLEVKTGLSGEASPELIQSIRDFIFEEK